MNKQNPRASGYDRWTTDERMKFIAARIIFDEEFTKKIVDVKQVWEMTNLLRIDIDQPRYDQSTYLNRAKHFFLLTNPLNILATNAQLEKAKRIVHDYKAGKPVPECKSVEDLWRAKYLYDSAFHPETGEKSILIGRMSANVPMNTLITGGLLVFYKSTPAVVFWQWINQTFNAVVNYTNRSGASPITLRQLALSYFLATGGALTIALYLNSKAANFSPFIGRLVPLAAIMGANCINIPMMRLQELRKGIVLLDEKNIEVGKSRKAAATGITNVVISRISMSIPGMVPTPMLMEYLTKKGVMKKYPWADAPIQMAFCGVIFLLTTPLCCAFISQRASIRVNRLEKSVRNKIGKERPDLDVVYYNKGL